MKHLYLSWALLALCLPVSAQQKDLWKFEEDKSKQERTTTRRSGPTPGEVALESKAVTSESADGGPIITLRAQPAYLGSGELEYPRPLLIPRPFVDLRRFRWRWVTER
jgi:hypothetical protein